VITFRKCRELTYDELLDIPPPHRRGHWAPIKHSTLVRELRASVLEAGFQIKGEKYGVKRKDLQLFGCLDFALPAGQSFPEGMSPGLVFRHSNDRRMALRIAAGCRVFCCENGMISGEISMRKLHYDSLELREELRKMIQHVPPVLHKVGSRVAALKDKAIGLRGTAEHFIIGAFKAEVLPWTAIKQVVSEWECPSFREFDRRDYWSLYNAFTFAAKTRPPLQQIDTLRRLNAYTERTVLCA